MPAVSYSCSPFLTGALNALAGIVVYSALFYTDWSRKVITLEYVLPPEAPTVGSGEEGWQFREEKKVTQG